MRINEISKTLYIRIETQNDNLNIVKNWEIKLERNFDMELVGKKKVDNWMQPRRRSGVQSFGIIHCGGQACTKMGLTCTCPMRCRFHFLINNNNNNNSISYFSFSGKESEKSYFSRDITCSLRVSMTQIVSRYIVAFIIHVAQLYIHIYIPFLKDNFPLEFNRV